MSGLTADDLLVGPRGRVLCMAVAHRLDSRVWTAWLVAAQQREDERRRDVLVRALGDVDVGPVRGWHEPSAFVDAVDEAVTQAMYWQPPHDEDLITAEPDVRAALRPMAAAIAVAPAAAWWSAGADLGALRYTSWSQDPAPPLTGAGDRLRDWRRQTVAHDLDAARDRPADPTAPWSGTGGRHLG